MNVCVIYERVDDYQCSDSICATNEIKRNFVSFVIDADILNIMRACKDIRDAK